MTNPEITNLDVSAYVLLVDGRAERTVLCRLEAADGVTTFPIGPQQTLLGVQTWDAENSDGRDAGLNGPFRVDVFGDQDNLQ